jgi:hypothetical protein
MSLLFLSRNIEGDNGRAGEDLVGLSLRRATIVLAKHGLDEESARRIIAMRDSLLPAGATYASPIPSERLPQGWTKMDTGVSQVPIQRDEDPDLWDRIEKRINMSLPDFELKNLLRIQNKVLWSKYRKYHEIQEPGYQVERELFHYAEPDVLEAIQTGHQGFEPKYGDGEYGAGTYFAQHAVYSVAYSAGWLNDDLDQSIKREREAKPEVMLLLVKVSLGRCKEFGARCRSSRGDAAAQAAKVRPGLSDWGPPVGRNGEKTFMAAPMRLDDSNERYDSVTGTEGDLEWAQHPRLRANGKEFGRQYVAFNDDQTYPWLTVILERKSEVTQRLQRALEEEERGKKDYEMTLGTNVCVKGLGHGVVRPGFKKNRMGANSHCLLFAGEDNGKEKSLKLMERGSHGPKYSWYHLRHIIILNGILN